MSFLISPNCINYQASDLKATLTRHELRPLNGLSGKLKLPVAGRASFPKPLVTCLEARVIIDIESRVQALAVTQICTRKRLRGSWEFSAIEPCKRASYLKPNVNTPMTSGFCCLARSRILNKNLLDKHLHCEIGKQFFWGRLQEHFACRFSLPQN